MISPTMEHILSNTTSGASHLYRKVLLLFISNRDYHTYKTVRQAVKRLMESFPEMAVFVFLDNEIKRNGHKNLNLLYEKLLSQMEAEHPIIQKKMRRFWRKKRRIVTLSQSSVVREIIIGNRRLVRDVLISVSSPKNEGLIMAENLANEGINVTVVADAALPGLIGREDFIFLGADYVTETFFVNKIGSYPLVLAAKEKKAKSFILFEHYKLVADKTHNFHKKEHPIREIIPQSQIKTISAENYYFEKIPCSLVYQFVSGKNKAGV